MEFGGQPLRVWQAQEGTQDSDAEPGTLVAVDDRSLTVATGDGTLHLTQLQLPGKRPMSVAEIRRGHPQLFVPGVSLG